MTTEIFITGQISGNYALLRKLSNYESCIDSQFNGKILRYKTKAAAKKALWEAYKSMRAEGYTPLRYSKYGSLSYDASRAVISQ